MQKNADENSIFELWISPHNPILQCKTTEKVCQQKCIQTRGEGFQRKVVEKAKAAVLLRAKSFAGTRC